MRKEVALPKGLSASLGDAKGTRKAGAGVCSFIPTPGSGLPSGLSSCATSSPLRCCPTGVFFKLLVSHVQLATCVQTQRESEREAVHLR